MPKISVIIPVYNTEKYIRQCLDSVVNQTLTDIEIICVNDGSTDGSAQILEEYASKDSRIKIIQQKNQGAGETRNKGIKIAQGEYIAFIDSDDFLEEDHFYEELYNSAKSENADVAKGNYKDYPSNYIPNFINEEIKKDKNCFCSTYCSAIIKKNLIDKHRIKFSNLKDMEDPVFAFEIALKANKVIILDELYIRIVKRENSITYGIPSQKQIKDKIKGLKKIIKLANKNNLLKESYSYICGMWMAFVFNDSMRNKNKSIQKYVLKEYQNIFNMLQYNELFCEKLISFLSNKNNEKISYYLYLYKKKSKGPLFYYLVQYSQKIFSLRTSQDKRHKIITVLGICLSISRKNVKN